MTADVDVVVEVTSPADYYELESELRRLGFRNVPEGPICRWVVEGVLVDVMPTDSKILGFANDWSTPAIRNATSLEIEPGTSIRMVTPAYFLATKLEAFSGRGEGDFLASRDIEDIIAVVDGRPQIAREVAEAPDDAASFVANTLADHLANPRFVESINGHLPGDPVSQARAGTVLERLRAMANRSSE